MSQINVTGFFKTLQKYSTNTRKKLSFFWTLKYSFSLLAQVLVHPLPPLCYTHNLPSLPRGRQTHHQGLFLPWLILVLWVCKCDNLHRRFLISSLSRGALIPGTPLSGDCTGGSFGGQYVDLVGNDFTYIVWRTNIGGSFGGQTLWLGL